MTTSSARDSADDSARQARLRRYWDRHAADYDRRMSYAERRFFADTRAWVCGQATGDTLEVAIGTGLNLAHYPAGVRLTGVEWSDAMLERAERRATELGLRVGLRNADAHALPFQDGAFDTVVCTFALCGIADDRRALAEMVRVLRPEGLLLLADHVVASAWPVRVAQALVETVTVPAQGEYFRRRPVRHVRAMGLTVLRQERLRWGVIERVVAAKAPAAPPPEGPAAR